MKKLFNIFRDNLIFTSLITVIGVIGSFASIKSCNSDSVPTLINGDNGLNNSISGNDNVIHNGDINYYSKNYKYEYEADSIFESEAIINSQDNSVFQVEESSTLYDKETGLVVGVNHVGIEKADIYITYPEKETLYFEEVGPGKVFSFINKSDSVKFWISKIDFIGSKIEITIK